MAASLLQCQPYPDMATLPILIVDDEAAVRQLLARLLQQHGYDCALAGSSSEARRRLSERAFSLMLCDMHLPGESGLQLVEQVYREYPDTATVMVTAIDDHHLATAALEHGAYAYILKPFQTSEIVINVANALRRHRIELQRRADHLYLEQILTERTMALRHAIEGLEFAKVEIRLSQEDTLQRLALAAEFKSEETARHIQRMSRYCELLARRIGLDSQQCEQVRLASPMHDIGKIGVPDFLLLKQGRLEPEEFATIARHTEIGYQMLSGSDSALLSLAAIIAWTHHEKFDGTGYPRRLAGEAIPLEGRITAIADVFDALTNKRAYKPAFPIEQAVGMMRERRGTHFDPLLLDTFLGALDEALEINAKFPDVCHTPAGSPNGHMSSPAQSPTERVPAHVR